MEASPKARARSLPTGQAARQGETLSLWTGPLEDQVPVLKTSVPPREMGTISSGSRQRGVVIGGGNVAVDAAMSALRLGASEVEMISLEEEGSLPASEGELAQARSEGVELTCGWGPGRVNPAGDRIECIDLVRCTSVFDSGGRFAPTFDPDRTMTRPADSLILAVGQRSRADLLLGDREAEPGRPGQVRTVRPRLYLGGDALSGPSSVALSMAAGKKAAAMIHLDLTGRKEAIKEALLGQGPAFSLTALFQGRTDWEPGKVVGFEDIDPVFLDHHPWEPIPGSDPEERKGSFAPIEPGLSPTQARSEAGRCFNCGTCVGCDTCFAFCPDSSVRPPGEEGCRYLFDQDYCKGCGICVSVCNRGVIGLEDKL